jgi:hypothetical protein
MNTEEKLNHLKDWLECWISAKISNTLWSIHKYEIYHETGNLMYWNEIDIIPFEIYLQIIPINNS